MKLSENIIPYCTSAHLPYLPPKTLQHIIRFLLSFSFELVVFHKKFPAPRFACQTLYPAILEKILRLPGWYLKYVLLFYFTFCVNAVIIRQITWIKGTVRLYLCEYGVSNFCVTDKLFNWSLFIAVCSFGKCILHFPKSWKIDRKTDGCAEFCVTSWNFVRLRMRIYQKKKNLRTKK